MHALERRPSRRSRRHAALAERVRDLILVAPESPHPITELAAKLNVSAFHLARVFRAETGLSPHQFLLKCRMELAMKRLRGGEESLSRLAVDLGFSSHSHFTAVFRRHYGRNPAAVRAAFTTANDYECYQMREA